MAVFHERRVSPAAQWAKTISGFSLVLAGTAAIGHRYAMVDTVSFGWVLVLVVACTVLGVLLAAAGFVRLWSHGDKAGKASLAAAVLSALVLAPFGAASYFALNYPALHDISTDLSEPPRFVQAQRARTPDMNPILPISAEAAALQAEAYPDVNGRRFEASMERVLDAAKVVVAARGWSLRSPLPISMPEGGELSVELIAPTFILRLPADAVIRFTDEGESTFVDMRLNSRYGRHDLASNAREIRSFMSDLDAEFSRQSLSIIDIPASGQEEDAVE